MDTSTEIPVSPEAAAELANLIPLGFDPDRDGVANAEEAADRIIEAGWIPSEGLRYEYGYSMVEPGSSKLHAEAYFDSGVRWWPTEEEAEKKRRSDLRFIYSTVVIRRLVSTEAEAVGEPSDPRQLAEDRRSNSGA